MKNWLVTFHCYQKGVVNLFPAKISSFCIMARDEAHADEVAEMLGHALKTETPYTWDHSSSRILEDPTT